MDIAANVDATSSATEYARYIHQCILHMLSAISKHSLEHSLIVRNLPPSLVSRQHLSRTIYHAPPPPTKDTCADTDLTPPPKQNTQNDIVAARTEVDNMFPQHENCSMQDVFCFAALANTVTGTMYTNTTGAFPVQSFKSMQYIYVVYDYEYICKEFEHLEML
jgi:hypothetical protein